MTIYIKTLTGITIYYDIVQDDMVQSLYDKVGGNLIFQDKILDPNMAIADTGMSNEVVIYESPSYKFYVLDVKTGPMVSILRISMMIDNVDIVFGSTPDALRVSNGLLHYGIGINHNTLNLQFNHNIDTMCCHMRVIPMFNYICITDGVTCKCKYMHMSCYGTALDCEQKNLRCEDIVLKYTDQYSIPYITYTFYMVE
jgi:hypothetical protein